MNPEKKRTIAKVLSLAVIIAGILVIEGWIFDIGVLKSLSPDWITMKISTAITFILSGISLYFIIRAAEGEFDKAQVVLAMTSLSIVLFIGVLLLSTLLKIHTGIEDLIEMEPAGAIKTVAPGRPTMPAMVNFLLIALAGVLTLLNPEKHHAQIKTIGYIVGAIGALAIAGYIMNAPLLYYFIEGKNSAMACNTAILFATLGVGLTCQSD